jgi:hypothetical protein
VGSKERSSKIPSQAHGKMISAFRRLDAMSFPRGIARGAFFGAWVRKAVVTHRLATAREIRAVFTNKDLSHRLGDAGELFEE